MDWKTQWCCSQTREAHTYCAQKQSLWEQLHFYRMPIVFKGERLKARGMRNVSERNQEIHGSSMKFDRPLEKAGKGLSLVLDSFFLKSGSVRGKKA